ncbi:MAG: hypothetical protein ABJE47_00125 [bacterium]
MANRIRAGAVALVALLFVVPGAVVAAQSDPVSIPAGLANALMAGNRNGPLDNAHFVVGGLPTGWPEALRPAAPARVEGGLNGGTAMVAVFSDTARRFLETYLRRIEGAGWAPPPLPPQSGFQSFGFQSNNNFFGSYGLFCHDSAGVTAVAVPGAAVGAFVHVTYRFREPGCNRQMIMQSAMPKQLVVPILIAPSTSRSQGGGSSGGGDEISVRTRLVDSTLSAEAVAAHYGKQLVSAGWKRIDAVSKGQVATEVFDATDGADKPWSGMLTVMASGSDRHVAIIMWRRARQ